MPELALVLRVCSVWWFFIFKWLWSSCVIVAARVFELSFKFFKSFFSSYIFNFCCRSKKADGGPPLLFFGGFELSVIIASPSSSTLAASCFGLAAGFFGLDLYLNLIPLLITSASASVTLPSFCWLRSFKYLSMTAPIPALSSPRVDRPKSLMSPSLWLDSLTSSGQIVSCILTKSSLNDFFIAPCKKSQACLTAAEFLSLNHSFIDGNTSLSSTHNKMFSRICTTICIVLGFFFLIFARIGWTKALACSAKFVLSLLAIAPINLTTSS